MSTGPYDLKPYNMIHADRTPSLHPCTNCAWRRSRQKRFQNHALPADFSTSAHRPRSCPGCRQEISTTGTFCPLALCPIRPCTLVYEKKGRMIFGRAAGGNNFLYKFLEISTKFLHFYSSGALLSYSCMTCTELRRFTHSITSQIVLAPPTGHSNRPLQLRKITPATFTIQIPITWSLPSQRLQLHPFRDA